MTEVWTLVAITVIRALVFVYDVISYPVYLAIQKPWTVLERSRRVKAKSISGKPEGPYVTLEEEIPAVKKLDGLTTIWDVFEYAVTNYQIKQFLGTREVFREEDEVQPNGKVFKKLVLGNYEWESFDRASYRVQNVAYALNHLGYKSGSKVVLFAETRAEWLLACLGCFGNNLTVVTLYATLGEDALVHAINETEVEVIFTSFNLLPQFKTFLKSTPLVKHVVFMEGLTVPDWTGYPDNVKFISFGKLEDLGKSVNQDDIHLQKPVRDDVAFIMYTSGSTGVPKGVIISHHNIISAMRGFSNVINFLETDVYMAYLPLAHVLELLAELMSMLHAVPIGYSTPLTLSDTSGKIKKGTKGDASLLRPTFMATVPLILDRMFKTAHDAVKDRGGSFVNALFQFVYEYKLRHISKGFRTPFIDRMVFKRLQDMLGGNLRVMAAGGAPLSEDTHNFVKVCISCPLLQAYGLTETCAFATAMSIDDLTVGHVGGPMLGCEILLEDWEEGNYHVTDKPNPRGEIIVGGDHVCVGYYKVKDDDSFFTKDGKRWFRTGDIGEFFEEGHFKIIDRKKDIVKLQFGEYVSLGKIEAQMKTLDVVDNVCVYGDSTKDYAVALVVPNERALVDLGKRFGKTRSFEELCDDSDIASYVEKQMAEHGIESRLQRWEIPRRVKLVSEVWNPSNDLVTAAYKLKRKNIQRKHQVDIDKLYS